MNRRLPLILGVAPLCLTGLLLSFPAAAADNAGWFAGGSIGSDFSTTQNFVSGNSAVKNGDNSGFIGGFNGGYEFGNRISVEGEFDYHHSSISSINVTTSTGTSSPTRFISGSVGAKVLMVNGWYDLKQPDGFLNVIYPYAGVGIGVANVSISGESFDTFAGSQGGANGSSTALAYQFGFGGIWDLSGVLSASFDFRYLTTSPFTISSESGAGLHGQYRAPSIMLGLKYHFGGSES